MGACFTVDLEWPHHALWPSSLWPHRDEEGEFWTLRLLKALRHHRVHAIFYTLGHVAQHHSELIKEISEEGHAIGSHGYWHHHGEREHDDSDQLAMLYLPSRIGYRSPYWDTTPRPGYAGGVFFRLLPYRILKAEVGRSGVLYVHPHDLYQQRTGPWRRHVCLGDPWKKLERLLDDVSFDEP